MYVELHARSAFSFLEGAVLPEQLARRCAELEIPGLALLDRDGVYGSPRMHIAAREAKIKAQDLCGDATPTVDMWSATDRRPSNACELDPV